MGALVTVTSFGIATVLSILLPLLIARFLLGGLFRSLLSVPKSPSGVNAGVKGQSAVGRT